MRPDDRPTVGVANVTRTLGLPTFRLTALVSWQTGRVSTLGARLTGRRMPLPARADFAVLAALEEYGAVSQAELGRRLGLDRNNVNEIVGRLDRERAIDRTVDPHDRRRSIIAITAAGRATLADLQAHADVVQSELLAPLSLEERRQLHDLLEKVLDGHGPQSA